MDTHWNERQQPYPVPSQSQPLHLLLPPGWISVVDPTSGKTYYANPSTGQTSWEPPNLPPPPPPPPPHLQIPPPTVAAHLKPTANPNATSQPIQNTAFDANGGGVNMTTHISSLQATGIFLPAVRAIVQSNETENDTDNQEKNELEFPELSTGVIADMVHVQSNYREQQALVQNSNSVEDERKKWYYDSLKPMELPIASTAPHIESGRVDIRIMSLMDALKNIEKQ